MLDKVVKLREKIDMNHFACQILEHAKRLLGPDVRDKLKDPVQTGVVVDLLLRADSVFMAVLDAGARPKNVDFREQITSYLCKPKKNLPGLLHTASTFVREQVENACVQFGIH